jgi:hypothetical protein
MWRKQHLSTSLGSAHVHVVAHSKHVLQQQLEVVEILQLVARRVGKVALVSLMHFKVCKSMLNEPADLDC